MSSNPLLTPPREVVIEILPGDTDRLLAEQRRIITEAEADALEGTPRRMVPDDAPDPMAAAEEFDRLKADALGRAVKVTLRGIGGTAFDRLMEEHPPRKDKKRDGLLGSNESTFIPALVFASIVVPEVTWAQFQEFWEQASKYNQRRLSDAAWELTAGAHDLPKSSAVSVLRHMRGTRPRRLEDTAPARAVSTGGSPESSTSS